MTPTEALEKQLLAYWQKSETQKTWNQWKKWLDQVGLPLSATPKQKIAASEKINYQMFLNLCEEELYHSPEWLKKLTDPDWLHQQKLVILPAGLSHVQETELTVMRQQISQLSQNLKQLQQKVALLENRVSSPTMPTPATSSVSPPASSSKSSLQKAQMMKKELIISHSAKKPKPSPPPDEKIPEITPKPLDEIYLSFNDWSHQFSNNGIPLQKLASASIQDKSKRQISFGQFGRRMEQKVDDRQQFQTLFQQFANQHMTDFIPDLPESPEESEQLASEELSESTGPENKKPPLKPFETPPEDLYHKFNDWLEWLKEFGIDPQEFASQDLKAPSTRKISFPQFCRRLERNLDNIEGFQNAIQTP